MVSCTAPALPGDAPPYERHRSEQTPLYTLVEEHFPRFLERLEDEGVSLPYFVREEFEPADDSEQLLGAAVHYRIATGPHAGRKALTLRTVGPSPLTLTLEDIRHSLDPRREEVALERIEAVLRQVQTLDHPGWRRAAWRSASRSSSDGFPPTPSGATPRSPW